MFATETSVRAKIQVWRKSNRQRRNNEERSVNPVLVLGIPGLVGKGISPIDPSAGLSAKEALHSRSPPGQSTAGLTSHMRDDKPTDTNSSILAAAREISGPGHLAPPGPGCPFASNVCVQSDQTPTVS